MAIDKSLYPQPEGIEVLDEESPLAEIEPVVTELEDGSVEVDFDEDDPEYIAATMAFGANLVDYLDEDEIDAIAVELTDLVEADMGSRKEWEQTLVDGMDTLGMRVEKRTIPWEDACGVFSTLLAEAAIRFQAEAMSETFPAAGPVRAKILGVETPEKIDSAERVKEDMNHQLTEVMVEYRPEHERMLYSLSLMGSAFKKIYQDPALNRPVSIYISAEDTIVPYGTSHINNAERVTHLLRKTVSEMEHLQHSEFYSPDIDLGDPVPYHSELEEKKAKDGGYSLTEDNRYTLMEIHAYIRTSFDSEDEPAPPYVVTIDKGTCKVLAIRRNWLEDDPLKKRRDHFVHYVYLPGFGFYGMGLIHIIGGYAKAGTSLIRQLVDAGTLSNLPGGLKTKGLRIQEDDTPIEPGEWRDVDVPSGTLRENMMELPYGEPSQTLLALLDRITEEGRRLGAISDMKISDMSAQAPVGTTLAILERVLKPMAAVQARVHFAMKQEFKILKEIIADHTPEDYTYEVDGGQPGVRRADYESVEVIPVSDPNSSTMAQRVVQYQAVIQLAEKAPQIYDMPFLHRQMIEILGVKNADKIIPMADDMKPVDPISENMNALVGKPVKAFIYQDHQAHLMAHQSFVQDPMIMASIGQNPMAQQIMGALQAHIAEHTAFLYRKQVEERLGAPLTMPNEELPEEVELQLSRLAGEAAQQLAQIHQQEAAQQEAQRQAEDPVLQLEKEKVANARMEIERKAAKDAKDGARADKELVVDAALEEEKIETDRMALKTKTAVDLAKTIQQQKLSENNRRGDK